MEAEKRETERARFRSSSHCATAQQCRCELNGRDDESVGQSDEDIRREVCSGPEGTDDLRIDAWRVRSEKASDLDAEQHERVESERREKPPAEILRLAQGRSVHERMDSCIDVARPRLTSDCSTDHEPDHAAHDGHGCDDEWRVEDKIF